MYLCVRASLFACLALTLLAAADRGEARNQAPAREPVAAPAAVPAPAEPAPTRARPAALISVTTLASLGFADGLRFANLGGRRDVFVPLPQGGELTPSELVLALDDVSAHEARRSLEILVNDRAVAAIASAAL